MSTDEASERRKMLGVVVGENVRRLRQEKGLSQAELAGLLTAFGSPWAKGRVVALETGARESVTADELFQLSNCLRAPLAAFFAGEEDMPVGKHGVIETEDVRRALERSEHVPVRIDSPAAVGAIQALVDEDYGAFEIAQRLDVSVARVQQLARRLFGQNTTQERAARVGDASDSDDAAYRRRTATQALVRELQAAIDQEDQA